MRETQSTEDARWEAAYQNAAERLFPDAIDTVTGQAARFLTPDEDEACIAAANDEIRES